MADKKDTDQEKIIKLKALQVELSAALEAAENSKEKNNPEAIKKIEGILDQISALTAPDAEPKKDDSKKEDAKKGDASAPKK